MDHVLQKICLVTRFKDNPGGYGSEAMSVRSGLLILALVVFLPLWGCAPALIKLQKEDLARLKNDLKIQAVHYPAPSFRAVTPESHLTRATSALMGLVPALLLIAASESMEKSTGEQIVKDFSLEDPSLRLKDQFLSALTAKLELKNIHSIQEPLSSDELDELKTTFGEGTVIDFKTTDWQLQGAFGGYRIYYSVQSRLARLEDSKITWQGFCDFSKKDSTSYSWDELIANRATLLKAKFNEAADMCAKELLVQFSGEEK